MKSFMKISVSFLIFTLLSLPLSAMDTWGKEGCDIWGEISLDGQSSCSSPSSEKVTIQDVELDEEKVVITLISEDGQEFKIEPKEQDIEKVKDLMAQKGKKDNARYAGQLAKGFVQQCVPGGLMLTAATGAVSEKYLGTGTLTEAFVGYFTRQTENNVFAGLIEVNTSFSESVSLNFEGSEGSSRYVQYHVIKNLELNDDGDDNKGLLSCGDNYVEVLQGNTDGYSIGGNCRSQVLWEIRKLEEGDYVIKNGRKLLAVARSWNVLNNPYSGYYCSLKDDKEKTEKYEDDVLWRIYHDKTLNSYVLANKGANPGFLCYADENSPNGHHSEILSASQMSSYKPEEYVGQGKHVNSTRWALTFAEEPLVQEGMGNWHLMNSSQSSQSLRSSGSSPTVVKKNPRLMNLFGSPRGSSSSPALINKGEKESELEEVNITLLDDGLYTLTNYALSQEEGDKGVLLSLKECSTSGFYTGVSEGLPQERNDSNTKWELKQVQYKEKLYYTIRNSAYEEGGFLTWLDNRTYSGYYLQSIVDNGQTGFLSNNYYPREKEKYDENGVFREHVLWSIFEAPQQPYCILRNLGKSGEKDPILGRLSYTSDKKYAQVLHKDAMQYNGDKKKYGNGGDFERSTWWQVSPVRGMHEG